MKKLFNRCQFCYVNSSTKEMFVLTLHTLLNEPPMHHDHRRYMNWSAADLICETCYSDLPYCKHIMADPEEHEMLIHADCYGNWRVI